MSDRDMMRDWALEEFLSDVGQSIEADLECEPIAPDLAAVVARAHEIDPDRVSADAVREVAELEPVVSLARERQAQRRPRTDPGLDAFVGEVREFIDQDIAERRFEGIPALASSSRTRRWWLAGGLAAAAAVVLAFGVQNLRSVEAIHAPGIGEALQSTAIELAARGQASRARTIEPPAGETGSTAEEEPEIEPEPEPASKNKRKRSTPKSTGANQTESLYDVLAELDREAHAAWHAGDRSRAARLFGRIVELAGRGRMADLAYGDLFTLARQSKDRSREAKLWREYLGRFPRGRFADDARAGLCRRAAGGARTECWTAYLRDLPKGSYRAQARREVGKPERER